jgi:hypothetical protein
MLDRDWFLAVHRHEKGSLSALRGEQRECSSDGRLSDASLSRDEEQATVGNAVQF